MKERGYALGVVESSQTGTGGHTAPLVVLRHILLSSIGQKPLGQH